jgi:hypothetical protein
LLYYTSVFYVIYWYMLTYIIYILNWQCFNQVLIYYISAMINCMIKLINCYPPFMFYSVYTKSRLFYSIKITMIRVISIFHIKVNFIIMSLIVFK